MLIRAIDRAGKLSPDQRVQLELALASDIRQLAIRIDVVRRKYAGRDSQTASGRIDRDTIAALQADAATCRRWLERAFEPGWLLPGVLDQVLSPEQAAAVTSVVGLKQTLDGSPKTR